MTNLDFFQSHVTTQQKYRNSFDNDAAFFHADDQGETSVTVTDCREHRFFRNYKGNVIPLFGMHNNLFKQEFLNGEDGINNEASCQCSCAVWCKYALAGNPNTDVHKDKKPEIKTLLTGTFNGLGGWTVDAHKENRGKFKTLLNALRNVRLTPRSIKPPTHSNVLQKALQPDGKPTIILQKSHVIAVCVSKATPPLYYCFDNNIGCVVCTKPEAAKKWLLWAAHMNGESAYSGTMASKVFHLYDPLTAVKCFPQ